MPSDHCVMTHEATSVITEVSVNRLHTPDRATVCIGTRVLSLLELGHLHTAINLETGRPMSIGNRTAHFRRLISENLGVRGSRVSIALCQPSFSALPLQLTCMFFGRTQHALNSI